MCCLLLFCKGKATISNDGATILKLLDVVHPAAKTLVDIARSQDAEVRGEGVRGWTGVAGSNRSVGLVTCKCPERHWSATGSSSFTFSNIACFGSQADFHSLAQFEKPALRLYI